MRTLTERTEWRALLDHAGTMAATHTRDLFEQDPDRFERFSLRVGDLLLDFSKNRINTDTLTRLVALARGAHVESLRDRMFAGERINITEDRPVLHTALRNLSGEPVFVDGADVMPAIHSVRDRIRVFSASVREGHWRGFDGARISDVVNIGIGGSDLGPAMVCEALRPYRHPDINVHFVSNLDGAHLAETLRRVDHRSTLFIVASKSFTTLETLTNAHSARDWLMQRARANPRAVASHFVAVSTNAEAVARFGIDPVNIFEFWDWVGGRYSLWSAIGLPVVLSIGADHFEELLAGAHTMDQHFRSARLESNMPVVLALLGIWNRNFLGMTSHAVVPYDQSLYRLPAYLQQLDMESNGKSVAGDGTAIVDYATAPVLWGEPGTNAQHAFFQGLHQGTDVVPCDFLAPLESHYPLRNHHRLLLANMFAQSEALMRGHAADAKIDGPQAQEDEHTGSGRLPRHQSFPGNRPSNTLLFRRLDPYTLGMLLALYEHKVFVQGAIWQINSFDQWGVELGKQLAERIAAELAGDADTDAHDASTNALINYCRRNRSTLSG